MTELDDLELTECHVCGEPATTFCDGCAQPICDECGDENELSDVFCTACRTGVAPVEAKEIS